VGVAPEGTGPVLDQYEGAQARRSTARRGRDACSEPLVATAQVGWNARTGPL